MPSEIQTGAERRVLGWIAPGRDTSETLTEAIATDPHADVDDVDSVLLDLESRGLVSLKGETWTRTKAGLKALTS